MLLKKNLSIKGVKFHTFNHQKTFFKLQKNKNKMAIKFAIYLALACLLSSSVVNSCAPDFDCTGAKDSQCDDTCECGESLACIDGTCDCAVDA